MTYPHSVFSGLVRCVCVVLLFTAFHPADAQSTPAEGNESEPVQQLGEEGTRALAQIYDYECTIPLEARTVELVTKNGLTREKIVFRGVQGFLVPGYLEYPDFNADARPCVLLLHGWSGSKDHWWHGDNYISGGNVRQALLECGYAVLALDAQCHGDRISQNDFAPVNHYAAEGDPHPRKGYFSQNDIYIQTVRDYRRGIDYLESRPDIDAKRIGLLGYSMGGTHTHLLMGTEKRIKVAVAVATPAERSKWSPIAPQNFLRGIGERPFMAIIGNRDELCPVAHARGRHALMTGPNFKPVIIDGEHKLPSTWVPEAIEWIKSHL